MGAGAVGNKNNTVMIKTKQNKTLLSFVEWEIKTVGGGVLWSLSKQRQGEPLREVTWSDDYFAKTTPVGTAESCHYCGGEKWAKMHGKWNSRTCCPRGGPGWQQVQ